MWAMSALSPPASGNSLPRLAQNGAGFFGIFLFAGMALGKLARVAVPHEAHRNTSRHRGPASCGARAGRGYVSA